MSFINRVMSGAMIVGASLGLTGCDNRNTELVQSRDAIVQEYMANSNPRDYEKAVGAWRDGSIMYADAQSTVDSLAYRNILDTHVAAQDSATIREFNQIAGKNRIAQGTRFDTKYEQLFNDLDNKMFDNGLTLKQQNANKAEYKDFQRRYISGMVQRTEPHHDYILATRQFKADSLAYDKFFKENNLMTEEVQQAIKAVAKKVKPALK